MTSIAIGKNAKDRKNTSVAGLYMFRLRWGKTMLENVPLFPRNPSQEKAIICAGIRKGKNNNIRKMFLPDIFVYSSNMDNTNPIRVATAAVEIAMIMLLVRIVIILESKENLNH